MYRTKDTELKTMMMLQYIYMKILHQQQKINKLLYIIEWEKHSKATKKQKK